MKTTFKNEINKFEKSYISNEDNIIEPVEYSIERVTEKVMSAIRHKPNKKKRWVPILAAAVLLTAAIGTTVLAATGVWNPFAEKIPGNTNNLKVLSNDSFRFTSSDDNLQAEFAGYVGDDDFALAAINITKKDGQPIIKDDGILEGKDEISKNGYTYRLDSEYIRENGFEPESPEYYLSNDKKTLTLYLTVNLPSGNMQHTTVHFDSKELYAYNITEKYTEYAYNPTQKVQRIRVSPEGDGRYFLTKFEGDKYVEYGITTKAYDLPYSVYLELDEKPEVFLKKEVDAEALPNLIRPGESVEMQLSHFKLRLTQHKSITDAEKTALETKLKNSSSNGTYDLANELSPFIKNNPYFKDTPHLIHAMDSGIVMKDGRKIFLAQDGNKTTIRQDAEDKNKWNVDTSMDLYFIEFPLDSIYQNIIKDQLLKVAVNPSDIATVVIEGNTVYTAEGFENTEFKTNRLMGNVWTSDDVCNILNGYTSDLRLMIVDEGLDDELTYEGVKMKLKVHGSKEEILSCIERLETETIRNLFIRSITLAPDENNTYFMEMKLFNPYSYFPDDDPVYITLTKNHWSSICSDYFTENRTPDSSVSFRITTPDKIMEEAPDDDLYDDNVIDHVLPIAKNPVKEPEKAPLIQSDMSKLTKKVWTEEEVRKIIHGENGQPIPKDQYTYSPVSPADMDTQSGDNTYSFRTEFTKTGLYNFINEMAVYEESNLFITDIELTANESNNGMYQAEIRLVNPVRVDTEGDFSEETEDYDIACHYGSIDRAGIYSDLLDVVKNYDMDYLRLNYPRQIKQQSVTAHASHSANGYIKLLGRNMTLDDCIRFKSEQLGVQSTFMSTGSLAMKSVDDPYTGNESVSIHLDLYTLDYFK